MESLLADITNSLIDNVTTDFILKVKEHPLFSKKMDKLDLITLERLLIISQQKSLSELTKKLKNKEKKENVRNKGIIRASER